MFKRIAHFFEVTIWHEPPAHYHALRRMAMRQLRILALTVRYFTRDKCSYRASALTFFTLLTIVPVLAMAFGIAKGFGLEALLEEQIRNQFMGQEEVMNRILTLVRDLLSNTREEVVAGIGVAVLFLSVLRILINIEDTMNIIWKVDKPRTIVRRITDYAALLIFAPILVAISSGSTVYITSIVKRYTADSEIIGTFTPILNFPIKILPYVTIWILLSFLYLVMPNQKVKIGPALIGGILAGTAYQVTQWGYITFQVGASNMNAIYGSFAALPLFLIWLQLSWVIVLFGAELSYAIQHVDHYEQLGEVKRLSPFQERVLTLLVAHTIIKQLRDDRPPLTFEAIGDELGMPLKLLQELLDRLQQANIIMQTTQEKQSVYLPARDINQLSIHRLIQILDDPSDSGLQLKSEEALHAIQTALLNQLEAFKDSPDNRLLRDIEA